MSLRQAARRLVPMRAGKRGSRHGSRGWDWFYNAVDERKESPAKPHSLHYTPLEKTHKRPRVFLDFQQDDTQLGRVVFEIADDVVPKTAENFLKLCSGDNIAGYSYKNSIIHKIHKGFIIQGGDVTNNDGASGHSAFENQYFDDENYVLQHGERGVLSMVNCGVHTNNSQFVITLAPLPHLDGRNVSIGRVVEGDKVIDSIENIFTIHPGKPLQDLKIVECGLVE